MPKKPLFAIIVPFKAVDNYVFECIDGCLKQTMQDFELILVPDKPIDKTLLLERFGKQALKKIKIVASGSDLPVGIPSAKRNIGIENTGAEFAAFIDSDAYPQPQWLESALPLLREKRACAVGGPNLEPEGVGFWESIAIKTMHLNLTDSGLHDSFKKYKGFAIWKELPTSNIIIKRKVLLQIGKFDESYATGEDVKACLLLRKTGKLILYNKRTAVHHHNRPSLLTHLPRVVGYGRGKIRALKETNSFRLANLLIIGFLLLVVSSPFVMLAFPFTLPFYAAAVAVYATFIGLDCLQHSIKPVRVPVAIVVVLLTQMAYGLGTMLEILMPQQK